MLKMIKLMLHRFYHTLLKKNGEITNQSQFHPDFFPLCFRIFQVLSMYASTHIGFLGPEIQNSNTILKKIFP